VVLAILVVVFGSSEAAPPMLDLGTTLRKVTGRRLDVCLKER
jgi:hypothetical protein